MPYEEDYKMWLEEALISMNPDWICDGMYDTEFTHDWCSKYCGEDDAYITPKCLHMYYHHIKRADRKTENSSEKPNNCEDWQDWKDRMWAEAIVTEPTGYNLTPVDKDINVRSKDEPRTEREGE